PIDPVRHIGNRSSGKMGYAVAEAARDRGAAVWLITAPVSLPEPVGIEITQVQTANEMKEAVARAVAQADALIMAAAVADYTPVRSAKTKTKKSERHLTIRLKPTPDILKWAGKHRKGKRQIVVGFALEDRNLRVNAEKKLTDKNLDMIVANSPEAIAADKSDVQIKTPDSSWIKIENATKAAIAKKVVHLAEKLYQAKLT
ncbi:MAG: phosphopantothenoylcysteine decarboxylase, partial [candidate division Zixibacteria bacterium]|nr:phosphopantothenoylcysteine decarboxylase [candidate division Zixibacteria bacterium]